MATWKKVLPARKTMCFEVIGKEAAWKQFARIKATPNGPDKQLGDRIGSKVVIFPQDRDRVVAFTPYHNNNGSVGESKIRVINSGPDAWTLMCEDSGDNDYNDYVIRVTIYENPALLDELDRVSALVDAAVKADDVDGIIG